MKLDYIITTTGRSGSVFIARLLTDMGIPCGHESVFTWRGMKWAERVLNNELSPEISYCSTNKFVNGGWEKIPIWLENINDIVADSSYMAAPFLNQFKNTKIIHTVRNPCSVIQSFCHSINYFTLKDPQNEYENFIYKFVPELKNNMSQYERCALYYIKWNELIESHNPDLFCKIEECDDVISEFVNKEKGSFNDRRINSFKSMSRKPFFLDMIKSNEIKNRLKSMMERYSYREEVFLI